MEEEKNYTVSSFSCRTDKILSLEKSDYRELTTRITACLLS